ncbi:MAG: PTS glucose transporter subunit IIA [Clostridia bacterium]|nr:PTS glucose transporter subunit IIA [Clostridia bacterium]
MLGLFQSGKKINVKAPVDGKVISLDEVPDEVFSKKMVGDGCAIIPSNDGLISSPIDGEILQIFKTNHAIGIRSHAGAEILIHIGIDTVDLEGKGFERKIESQNPVHTGDVIIQVDMDYLRSCNKPTVTPVVVTNSNVFEVINIKQGNVKKGDTIMTVKKIRR